MIAKLAAFAAFLFGAEIVASLWTWGRAPTDTIRVWYSGFWQFEVGRLHYWIPALGCSLVLWMVVWYAFLHHGRPLGQWLFTAVVAAGLEVATSVLYWKGPQSSSVRGLYQSVWAWNRVPQANEMGWPSLRIYLRDHLDPWIAMLVLVGICLLYAGHKKHPLKA